MLLTAWFTGLWFLAVAAQERRSPRLALLLAGAEGLVLLVAVFNARHHNYKLGLVTSIVDALLAAWIIMLALRLCPRPRRTRAAPQDYSHFRLKLVARLLLHSCFSGLLPLVLVMLCQLFWTLLIC